MTPEEDIQKIVASVCPQSGHWPYTRDADLYIGYRPGEETLRFASDRPFTTSILYDVVICAKRGVSAARMEALRYTLYAALQKGGWKLTQPPGPESYIPAHELFLWPLTVGKMFYFNERGEPEDIATYKARIAAEDREEEAKKLEKG